MQLSLIPAFAGLLALALLPKDDDSLLWTRWGCYFITILGNIASPRKSSLPTTMSLGGRVANGAFPAVMWTLFPSNVAGRTKKSVTSTILLIAYCAGNTIGAQVFQDKDAPMYTPAIVVCAVMYAVEFILMVAWRSYCKDKHTYALSDEAKRSLTNAQINGRTRSERRSLQKWA